MSSMRNVLFVLSGPSGVGKGTIAKKLIERNNIALSISCTTRLPRNGEIDGKDYFFISKRQFVDKIKKNGFLEYSEHFGNFYGTPKDFVENHLADKDVLLEIDVDGGLSVKKNFGDAILIMIVPPTLNDIKKRLESRNTESDENIKLRMERIDYELGKKSEYDYVIVNDDLSDAVNEIEKILKKEKAKKGE